MAASNILSVSGITDEAILRTFDQVDTFISKVTPFAKFQYVTVTFNGTANADTDIIHGLKPVNPELVNYIVVRIDRAASIYHDATATRKPWTQTTIYLRSNVANAVATLLLTLKPS